MQSVEIPKFQGENVAACLLNASGKWFFFTTSPWYMQLNTQITKFTGSLEKLTVPELIINTVGLQGDIFKIATACGKFPRAFPAGF